MPCTRPAAGVSVCLYVFGRGGGDQGYPLSDRLASLSHAVVAVCGVEPYNHTARSAQCTTQICITSSVGHTLVSACKLPATPSSTAVKS